MMRRALLLRSEVKGVERNAEHPGSAFSSLSGPVPDPKRHLDPAEGIGVLLCSSSWGRFYWGPWQVPVISPRFDRIYQQGKSLGTIWGRSNRILCQGDGIPVNTGHFMTVRAEGFLPAGKCQVLCQAESPVGEKTVERHLQIHECRSMWHEC